VLIFNEGNPGSGKSYDAVKTHLLPALKKGRHVYARINGLDHARIATHLDLPEERVRDLLHHVPAEEVGALVSLDVKDALVLIDEAHEFYVSSREALPMAVEEMFAKHRHRGWDMVLMSQYYKRIHRAVRSRVQRKDVFTKLDSVGLDGRYTVRHYTAIEPEKYEQVGTETEKYDPAIFQLYKSVQDGTTNFGVYDGGKFTVWDKLRKYAILMVPLGLWAVWYLLDWFNHPHAFKKEQGHAVGAPRSESGQGKAADGVQDVSRKKGIDTTGMPAEVAYVFDLANQGRPRLAALARTEDGNRFGYVEFRDSQSHVLDRLDLRQLSSMGVNLSFPAYGMKIEYKSVAFVATPWPLDLPGRISDEQNRQIDSFPIRRRESGAFPLPSDSEPEGSAGADSSGDQRPHGDGAFESGPRVNASGHIASSIGRGR